ncbi:mucoidy inhibitor MuiA family protein [Jiulongibacter sp. NS-SX5]|uniref:mucoidy inhibitor MuiA family protein n=1 Tax=Jiulongibacter sp. NS-SX5 TaxID=3463854 RepID=UPI004059A49D
MRFFKLFLLFLPSFAWAQSNLESKVKKVNIYPQGAQVFREVVTDLKKGDNPFVLPGISNEISIESIQINLSDNDLNISDLSFQTSFLRNPEIQKRNTAIKTEINTIIEEKSQLKIDLTVLEREEKLLLSNQKVGGTYSGMKPEDLKNTVDFFKSRMQEILEKKNQISQKLETFDDRIRDLNKELNKLMIEQSNRLSEILFTIYSENDLEDKKIEISYFTPNAGWSPTYDIKANDFNLPIQLLYKAEVYQYTGENWNDVNLTFNNLMPNAKANLPEIKPWVWGIPNDYSKPNDELNYSTSNRQISGFVVEESSNEPIRGVSIILKETTLGTTTDENGYYSITIPPDRQNLNNFISYSFVGFTPLTLNAKEIPTTIKLNEDTNALEEVVVMGYAKMHKKSMPTSNIKRDRSSALSVRQELKKLIIEEEAPTSLQFTLANKTTLESSGKTRSIDLKELQIPAYFEHVAVPKIEQSVFVNASITDWESLNLMPGKASIYSEGTFLGVIDLELPTSDTLNISLGKDPGVFVSRKLLKSSAKNKILGNDIEESFQFEILVRNTKSTAIDLKVIDQFPLSRNKEVEVFDKEAKGATINDTSGTVNWKTTVPPNTNKTFNLGYHVKYPKDGYITE